MFRMVISTIQLGQCPACSSAFSGGVIKVYSIATIGVFLWELFLLILNLPILVLPRGAECPFTTLSFAGGFSNQFINTDKSRCYVMG